MAGVVLREEQREELKRLRHEVHRHPEVGFQEHETRERMRAALVRAGLEPRAIRVCALSSPVVLWWFGGLSEYSVHHHQSATVWP